MSKENLIYNYIGKDYYERIDKEEGSYLYEGHHGKYIGDIIEDEIYDCRTGEYLGEILEGRLIVDCSKVGVSKIKGKSRLHRDGKMGHACIPHRLKLPIPKGYEDFTVGW